MTALEEGGWWTRAAAAAGLYSCVNIAAVTDRKKERKLRERKGVRVSEREGEVRRDRRESWGRVEHCCLKRDRALGSTENAACQMNVCTYAKRKLIKKYVADNLLRQF